MKNYAIFMAAFLALHPQAALAADNVRITEVDNINLGTWNISSVTGNDAVCVYRSAGGNTYKITATDNSTIIPGGFYLENGSNKILYSLTWGNTPTPGSTVLNDGIQANASGAHTTSSSCGGGDTANIKVDINNSAMAGVPAGTYKATVTMVIAP